MNDHTSDRQGRKLSFWERWKEALFLLAVIAVSSAVLWRWPEGRGTALLVLLGSGAVFDLLSVLSYLTTFLSGKPYSGFFGVGMVCYFWAWLSYPSPVLMLPETDTLPAFWLAKLVDLGVLLCLSLAVYIPLLFMDTRTPPRDE